jgi:hypothetical protein
MINLKRGQIQLRGRLRWKFRRAAAYLKHGPGAFSGQPIVFGNAIPKCGSKLLFNILRALEDVGPFVDTGLNEIKPFFRGEPTPTEWIQAQITALGPGDIRFGYIYAQPDLIDMLTGDGHATFIILRDPRDQIVSEIFYALEMHPGHAFRDYLQTLPDMQARIHALTVGVDEGPFQRVGVKAHYQRFMPWIVHPEICAVKFEDLIGDRESQIERMLGYLESCGFEASAPRLDIIERMVKAMQPKKSETFRKGVSGAWKEHYSPDNIAVFKKQAGDMLVELGYEEDLAW